LITGTETRWSDQRSVVSESGIPSFAAKRAPALPVLAKPIAWIAVRNRVVRREQGARQVWKTLRKDVPRTTGNPAKELLHGEQEARRSPQTGQISGLAAVGTVDG